MHIFPREYSNNKDGKYDCKVDNFKTSTSSVSEMIKKILHFHLAYIPAVGANPQLFCIGRPEIIWKTFYSTTTVTNDLIYSFSVCSYLAIFKIDNLATQKKKLKIS